MIRRDIYEAIEKEREAQDSKFGVQDWSVLPARCLDQPFDARGYYEDLSLEEKSLYSYRKKRSIDHTWDNILLEEVYEALSGASKEEIQKELIQVAAVAVAMIECLERSNGE